MKTIATYFVLITFLFSVSLSFAQTTYVPDDNFEQALIDLGYDDVLDDYVLTANIDTITILNVYSEGIMDLTGIAGFTALTDLNCASNQLITIDVTQNTALIELKCFYNQLTTLDVTQNTALTSLGCGGNQLTTLDVTQNTALTSLGCIGNELTTLDVTQNTALTSLDCYSNELTTLDVTQNTALTSLDCYSNQFTTLDTSQNTALNNLYCSNNQLIAVDVSQNTALTRLDCRNNQLTTLDIRNGNNTNISNYNFNATNNPNLLCIAVDDEYLFISINPLSKDICSPKFDNLGTKTFDKFLR